MANETVTVSGTRKTRLNTNAQAAMQTNDEGRIQELAGLDAADVLRAMLDTPPIPQDQD